MKSYEVEKDIRRIMAILDMSIEELAEAVSLSRMAINDILTGKTTPNDKTLEKIYGFSYSNRVNLSRNKEMLYRDDAKGRLLLFHGTRMTITGDIDTHHSTPPNDFGDGFYTGESLMQAASLVSRNPNGSVYCFYYENNPQAKVIRFNADIDWLYVILYYRNWFAGKNPSNEVLDIVGRVESSDLVIAPIADNEMFRIIDSFARNEITDQACLHAISATNLGIQYVFKSDASCKALQPIERLFLCKKERQDYVAEKDRLGKEGVQKARLSLIEYRREGRFFDEIF